MKVEVGSGKDQSGSGGVRADRRTRAQLGATLR